MTVATMPSMDDVADSALTTAGDAGGALVWRSPGVTYGASAFDPGVGEGAWRGSLDSRVPRAATLAVRDPACLVDPDDPAVVKAAEHVSSLTRGMRDWAKVQAALNLVQTGVEYTTDSELYGVEDFWARPAETLFLKRGDCEDTAVLFCSIVLAMGLDAVLLDFPGHMAAGVRLTAVPGAAEGSSFELGGGTWWYCETATDEPLGVGALRLEGDYVVEEPRAAGAWEAVVSAFAWYRSVIRAATGA